MRSSCVIVCFPSLSGADREATRLYYATWRRSGMAARVACRASNIADDWVYERSRAHGSAHLVVAFQQGLAEAGLTDGQNVKIEYRWAEGDYDRLPALAADLVSRNVAVLVGVGGDVSALAAKRATTTIPVVFGMGADPVKAGLVASFNRPGGNVTGFTLWTSEMESKRLGLLRELVPAVPLIGILANPQFPPTMQEVDDLELAAKGVNQRLLVARADNDAELDVALTSLVQQHAGAVLVTAAPSSIHGEIELSSLRPKIDCPLFIIFVNTRLPGG